MEQSESTTVPVMARTSDLGQRARATRLQRARRTVKDLSEQLRRAREELTAAESAVCRARVDRRRAGSLIPD